MLLTSTLVPLLRQPSCNYTSLPSCLSSILSYSWIWIYFYSSSTEDALRVIHRESNFPIVVWNYEKLGHLEFLDLLSKTNFKYTHLLVSSGADLEAFKELMIKAIQMNHFKIGDYVNVARISCDLSDAFDIVQATKAQLGLLRHRLTTGIKTLMPEKNTEKFYLNESCLQQLQSSEKRSNLQKVVLLTSYKSSTSRGLWSSKGRIETFYGRDFRDSRLLEYTFQYLGVPYKFIDHPDANTHGNEGNSNKEAFEEVRKGKADINVNSRIFTWSNTSERKVDHVHPLCRDDVVILVPNNISFTRTLIFPYMSLDRGFFLLVMLALFTLFYIYLKCISSNSLCITAILVFISTMTGKPFKELNVNYFRLAYASLLVFSFFTVTVFTYQLYSEFTSNKKVERIKSVQDLIAIDLKIFARKGIRSKITYSLKDDPVYKKIIPRIIKENDSIDSIAEEVKYLQGCYPYAIFCRESTVEFYRYLQRDFCYHKISESLMPSLTAFIVGYKHPLVQKINGAFIVISETGLLNKFHIRREIERRESDRIKSHSMMVLTLNSMHNIWSFYFMGMSLACLAFLIEIIVNYFKKHVNRIRIK